MNATHQQIIDCIKQHSGASADKIASHIKLADLPSVVINTLNEMRTLGMIEAHFVNRSARYYLPGTQPKQEAPAPAPAPGIKRRGRKPNGVRASIMAVLIRPSANEMTAREIMTALPQLKEDSITDALYWLTNRGEVESRKVSGVNLFRAWS